LKQLALRRQTQDPNNQSQITFKLENDEQATANENTVDKIKERLLPSELVDTN